MPEQAPSEQQRWETRFGAPDYLFGTEPNAFLRAQAHRLRAGQSALAVADGEGRNGVWLAEQGLDVLSIDYSVAALAKAQALAQRRGVKLRTELADVFAWRWPRAAFDVIAAIFIFAAAAERPAFFANLKVALKPGGLLLMQGYRPEQLQYRTGGPSDAERLLTRAILDQDFGDMAELEIREHDGTISEGSAHRGMSALIDLVARK
ncbi:MAG: class I SAM-dependent methyltransferase [Xanthobacteraceae bacterium]